MTGYTPPESGGCWYCHTTEGTMHFCDEFDTYVHLDCIRHNLAADPYDLEGLIIAREFAIDLDMDADEIQRRIDVILDGEEDTDG